MKTGMVAASGTGDETGAGYRTPFAHLTHRHPTHRHPTRRPPDLAP